MNLKGRNKITPEFNMSSMTDIVFLLLIFFMIASTLAKNLETIDVKLPQAKGKTENRNTVSLTINKRRDRMSGTAVNKAGNVQKIVATQIK